MFNTEKIPSNVLNRLRLKLLKTKKTSSENKILSTEKKEISLNTMEKKALSKCINNLEFINCLETSLEDQHLKNMPLEFFTALNQLKNHSQTLIIKTICTNNS